MALLRGIDVERGEAYIPTGRSWSRSRHQTLRQAIAWSHGLLDAAERKLLGHLAVCAGGFTLEAVERELPPARPE